MEPMRITNTSILYSGLIGYVFQDTLAKPS